MFQKWRGKGKTGEPLAEGEIKMLCSDVAQALLRAPGYVITSRQICRKKSIMVDFAVSVMRMMTLDPSNPLHVGQYVNVQKSHVFYKCPPSKISHQALAKYGITPDEYASVWMAVPPSRQERGFWDLVTNYPYDPVTFPMQSLAYEGRSPAEVARAMDFLMKKRQTFQNMFPQ